MRHSPELYCSQLTYILETQSPEVPMLRCCGKGCQKFRRAEVTKLQFYKATQGSQKITEPKSRSCEVTPFRISQPGAMSTQLYLSNCVHLALLSRTVFGSKNFPSTILLLFSKPNWIRFGIFVWAQILFFVAEPNPIRFGKCY